MSLVKTDSGKEALKRRDPTLTPRERQIIVLANGKLSRAAMAALMENDIHAEVDRLVQAGYLAEEAPTAASQPTQPIPQAATTGTPAGTPAAPATATTAAAPRPSPADASTAAATPHVQQQPGGARRSLAGTKMYIMDMLQLMRDMDASSMAVTIHTSEGEMEFIRNAIIATRLIAQKSSLSYGLRVVAKLRELVPQAHVPAIEALAQEFEAGPVTPP